MAVEHNETSEDVCLKVIHNLPYCYRVDNYMAYYYDNWKKTGSDPKIKMKWLQNLKVTNFVPTYDKWCLYCNDKNEENIKRCSGCHSVYFCSEECQLAAWPIHKKHCKRDLFVLCSFCGALNPALRCDKCPVKFCSESCKDKIYNAHKEFDCDYFSQTFI